MFVPLYQNSNMISKQHVTLTVFDLVVLGSSNKEAVETRGEKINCLLFTSGGKIKQLFLRGINMSTRWRR